MAEHYRGYIQGVRGDTNRGWAKSLMGNVILRIGVGVMLVSLSLLVFYSDRMEWYWAVVGMVIGGLVALWGDKIRTRKIYVDPKTGQVEKRNL